MAVLCKHSMNCLRHFSDVQGNDNVIRRAARDDTALICAQTAEASQVILDLQAWETRSLKQEMGVECQHFWSTSLTFQKQDTFRPWVATGVA